MAEHSTPQVTVEQLLAEARSELERLSPSQARAAAEQGALLIDIRSETQRARDGAIPAAKHFHRNVLEWRLDPSSPDSDPDAARRDKRLIVFCNEGYQSSLAAATLKRFGLQATDLVGGFQAWREAGFPIENILDNR